MHNIKNKEPKTVTITIIIVFEDELDSGDDCNGLTIPDRVVDSDEVSAGEVTVVLMNLDDNISDIVDADVILLIGFVAGVRNESIPKTKILLLSIANIFVSPDFKAFNKIFDSTAIELDNFSYANIIIVNILPG
jgi:hypothetical protein